MPTMSPSFDLPSSPCADDRLALGLAARHLVQREAVDQVQVAPQPLLAVARAEHRQALLAGGDRLERPSGQVVQVPLLPHEDDLARPVAAGPQPAPRLGPDLQRLVVPSEEHQRQVQVLVAAGDDGVVAEREGDLGALLAVGQRAVDIAVEGPHEPPVDQRQRPLAAGLGEPLERLRQPVPALAEQPRDLPVPVQRARHLRAPTATGRSLARSPAGRVGNRVAGPGSPRRRARTRAPPGRWSASRAARGTGPSGRRRRSGRRSTVPWPGTARCAGPGRPPPRPTRPAGRPRTRAACRASGSASPPAARPTCRPARSAR